MKKLPPLPEWKPPKFPRFCPSFRISIPWAWPHARFPNVCSFSCAPGTDDRDPILVSLVSEHLEDLEKQRYKPLMRHFHIDLDTLKEYIGIIQGLEPRPGGSLGSSTPCYVSPDIFVRKVNGEFVILMNDEDLPHLQLSPLSEELASQNCSSDEKDYMNDRLRSAVWIIRSLEERQRTLYQVMESISEAPARLLRVRRI